MNLFEIKSEYLAVLDLAENPEADPQTVADTLEAINADFEEKCDNCAFIIKQLKVDIAALKEEKKRLDGRIYALEKAVERLLASMLAAMVETGKTKFKTLRHSFWTQANPPAVKWVDGATIPEKYLIPQEPKRDTAGVLAALKAGEKFDFAEITQTEGVRFR